MSTINVRQAHTMDIEGAKAALNGFEADLQKRGAKLVWSGSKAEIQGIGVSGNVQVTESDVQITLKLGLVAKAAGVKADKLEASIVKRLAAAYDQGA